MNEVEKETTQDSAEENSPDSVTQIQFTLIKLLGKNSKITIYSGYR